MAAGVFMLKLVSKIIKYNLRSEKCQGNFFVLILVRNSRQMKPLIADDKYFRTAPFQTRIFRFLSFLTNTLSFISLFFMGLKNVIFGKHSDIELYLTKQFNLSSQIHF